MLLIVAGCGVALSLGLGVLGLVVLDRTALRHDLITADFTVGAGPFETGSTEQFKAYVESGTYVLEATTAPDSPASSFAMFTREAFNVTVAVTISDVADSTEDAAVGVACMDLPETNGHGYLFAMREGEVALIRTDKEQWSPLLTHEVATGSLDGRRIEIACRPVGSTVHLTGSIDGSVVIASTDEDGFTSYRGGMLVFLAYDEGDLVRFDDVDARVPGE